MAFAETEGGVEYQPRALDQVERLFWRDIWETVPAEVATSVESSCGTSGRCRCWLIGDLPRVGMLNLILGAAEPGAVADGHLAKAAEWTAAKG